VPYLSKKGFLEILFELLSQEREREIFGNIVTAIAYLSVQPDCRERIIRQDIISRIVSPLNQLPEIDQKLVSLQKVTKFVDYDINYDNAFQWA
jgi:hypothetical protein